MLPARRYAGRNDGGAQRREIQEGNLGHRINREDFDNDYICNQMKRLKYKTYTQFGIIPRAFFNMCVQIISGTVEKWKLHRIAVLPTQCINRGFESFFPYDK